MPNLPKLIGAALLAVHLSGVASAQEIDPGEDRLPRFMADVCGTGGEGRGIAAYFSAGSPTELAGVSDRTLRYVFEGMQRDGGWVLLTGHVDAAEASEAGRLDRLRTEFVRDWLIAQGLPPERIWLRTLGTHEPIVSVDGAQQQNRRVEFFMTHTGAACRQRFRNGVHAWFRQNCFPALRAADSADCDEALRLLR